MFRLSERLDRSFCSSDGMRINAWHVAVEGAVDNLFLPSSESYYRYYQKSPLGVRTMQECRVAFDNSHSFFLEQLYLGGLLWFLIVCYVLFNAVWQNRTKVLGIGLLAFLVFLAVSPVYFTFYIVLLSWVFLLYNSGVEKVIKK